MFFQNVTPFPSISTIMDMGMLYGFTAGHSVAAQIVICMLYGFAAGKSSLPAAP